MEGTQEKSTGKQPSAAITGSDEPDNEPEEASMTFRSSFKDPTLSPYNMVLVIQNDSHCQSLAMALMQISYSMSANHNRGRPLWYTGGASSGKANLDRKVVEALERTVERKNTNSTSRRAKRRFVHVVETIQDHIQLISDADHIVVVLSTEDIMSWLANEATKSTLSSSSQRKFKPRPVDQHPLVQQCLQNLPNPTDTILLQMISIVLVIRQVEDAEVMDLLAATFKANKKSLFISCFVCRPDEPPSCQTVARMLWTRLDKSRTSDDAPASRFLRSANP